MHEPLSLLLFIEALEHELLEQRLVPHPTSPGEGPKAIQQLRFETHRYRTGRGARRGKQVLAERLHASQQLIAKLMLRPESRLLLFRREVWEVLRALHHSLLASATQTSQLPPLLYLRFSRGVASRAVMTRTLDGAA